MIGFNTKERNNYGEYEITFYTDNHEDFKRVQDLCRELIDHDKLYNPKGDCISRSALKKTLQNREECKECPDIDCIHCFYDIIDNASTVEPFEPDYVGAERLRARQRGYEEGYHNGMAIGKTLNPKIKQGEWIEDSGNIACSHCRAIWLYRRTDFCPNCGAKMDGGAE